ncbi:membrane-associated phospholipid phosphatase [Algoriphagus ratkowskyi]|uniref:Membrane-associated phospholipid phosphatase n=1 Tax=Algoriphagus ratkowskyi TaxID=57028 RepID=A0A2W7S5K6_9BACT|nr:phosphatase PAP2 family protein [Algoriphagus ratkowskyi]PZX58235.1 membrane-associated phospholipid phosphatase [Algoriphagus ratkowskyi]TXD77884.1 phosphatase PAP2 family protein [Algoriphagus ratkowskyi]
MKKIVSLLLFLTLSVPGFSQNLDIDILKNINLNRNEKLDPAFEFISNTVTPISIATPAIILSVGLLEKNKEMTHKGLFIAETLVVSTLITSALKYSVDRPRPYETYSFINNVLDPNSPSFPSGHTSAAFATATSLSLSYRKWYVIAPSYLWASTVAYSRMDLGVHYPRDVLAGAVVGAGSAYLCYYVNKKVFHRK